MWGMLPSMPSTTDDIVNMHKEREMEEMKATHRELELANHSHNLNF